jgi:hypothetical protein
VLLAKARFSFTTASPIDQAALLGVVSIWVVVFLVGAMIAGMLSYDLFFTGKDVAPPRQVAPNPNSVAPLVHIGIDPLLTGTPAAQPQATPTRRTLFLVVPTPAK